jgi:alkanesulfonate monooxygenase SsuD/methylene tetrahydromethanopterin reductase-like flavin-dependent oxidoreductase (luciferase family)
MMLSYAGGFKESVDRLVELEKAGLDMVWVPEAYSFDAISQVGYLAACTERLEIGTGIVNVLRTPADGDDGGWLRLRSNGRFVLGLGASGRRSWRASTASRTRSR